jgi:hypothetical protein
MSKTDTYSVTVKDTTPPSIGSPFPGGTRDSPTVLNVGASYKLSITVFEAGSPPPTGYVAIDGARVDLAQTGNPYAGVYELSKYWTPTTAKDLITFVWASTDQAGNTSTVTTYARTKKIGTQMVVTTSPPASLEVGNKFIIAGYLQDVNGNRLAGKQHVLNVNGADVGTGSTGFDGSWSWEVTPSSVGTYTVYVRFPGDDTYEGC